LLSDDGNQGWYPARWRFKEGEMETVWNDLFKELEKATERIKVLEDALLSISQNTCCWSCQEAAKVAMKALTVLEAERDRLKEEYISMGTLYNEACATITELRARHAALVEAASWALNYIRGDLEPHAYCTTEYIASINKLKAALADVKG
jgi:hypothetical protein